jgi:single-stranded DNA-specific DHH superfamily exonuclease
MFMDDFLKSLNMGEVGKTLKTGGRKILVYHSDVDGMCSAALLMKFFPGFRPVPREGPVIDEGFLGSLIRKRPDVLVFLDIPADQEWRKLLRLKRKLKLAKLAIIDHHIIEKDMNSFGMTHVNPRSERKEIYIPASAVMYKILEVLGYPVKKFLWICVVGVIADYGFEDCKELLEECEKTYPGSLSDKPSPFKLSKIAEMLSALITLKGLRGAKTGLDLLVKFENVEDIRKHKDLRDYYKRVRKEIERIMEDFGKHAEFVPGKKLIIYEIKSELNITSIIATKITDTYKDEVIVIRKKSRQGWKVSLRCQSGETNVGDLAKKVSQGIGAGGGHQKSAGALVKDWERFRKGIVKHI